MITQPNNFKKMLHAFGMLVILLMCAGKSNAQWIEPVTLADPLYYTTGQPTWMNNALFVNGSGTLYGVVWDDGAGTLTLSLVDDAGTPNVVTTPLTGPGFGTMSHPDMILGGDGTHNYVMVVYTVTNGSTVDVYTESYTVTGVGGTTGFLTLTSCGANVRNVSNTGTARDAHIDLANQGTGGTYCVADIFTIAWEDEVCWYNTQNYGAVACWGSLSLFNSTACSTAPFHYSPGCLNNNGIGGHEGNHVDIAVKYVPATGRYAAAFTYDDPGAGFVYAGTWVFTPSFNNLTTGAMVSNPGINYMEYPRIDVLDDVPNGLQAFQAEITYRYFDGLLWQVASVNPSAGTDIITNYFATPSAGDNSKPVVTRGTGTMFSVAFKSDNDDRIYLGNVDWKSGYLSQFFNPLVDYDLYEVSMNANVDGPVAISNDYLSAGGGPAPDQELVCWYNTGNGEINCKHTAAYTPVFKPTGTMVMKKGHKAAVYPNPASGHINIRAGNAGAVSYSISDITGKELQHGAIDQELQRVPLSGLAKGMYLLNVKNRAGITEVHKIMKD